MNDSEIYPVDPQDAPAVSDELDDVEGHGLKEVAVGLGAAAVLAGGAAGSMHLSSAPLGVHSSGSNLSITVVDPIDTAGQALHGGLAAAQSTSDGAIQTTDQEITDGLRTVANAPTTLDRAVQRTTETLGTTVAGAEQSVQEVKAWATGPVVDAAKADVHAVQQVATSATGFAKDTATDATGTVTAAATGTAATAGTAVTNLENKATSTVRDTDRKIATILSVTTTTASDRVHTAVVTLRSATDGAGVQADTAGGWVLVKSGDLVLAQVHMSGGTATASWTAPVTGAQSVTITYTGDSTFAAASRVLDL